MEICLRLHRLVKTAIKDMISVFDVDKVFACGIKDFL